MAFDWENSPKRFLLAAIYHEVAAVIGWNAALDFGYQVWMNCRPPSRARKLCGRGVIYVPHTLGGDTGRDLVKLAGRDNAEKLVAVFKGSSLEFPNTAAAFIDDRNRAIVKDVQDGTPPSTVAIKFGMSGRRVRQILSSHNQEHSQNVRIESA